MKKITEGKTIEDWIKYVYDGMGLQEFINWEEFQKKEYYVFPTAKDWEKDPPGMRKFYEDPVKIPYLLPRVNWNFTPRGWPKNFPDDQERPPIPQMDRKE